MVEWEKILKVDRGYQLLIDGFTFYQGIYRGTVDGFLLFAWYHCVTFPEEERKGKVQIYPIYVQPSSLSVASLSPSAKEEFERFTNEELYEVEELL